MGKMKEEFVKKGNKTGDLWKQWLLFKQLNQIGNVLCDKSTIKIRACDAGLDEDFVQKLATAFGPGVKIKMWPCEVSPDGEGGVIQKDPDAKPIEKESQAPARPAEP